MASDMGITTDTLKELLDTPQAAHALETLLGAFAGEETAPEQDKYEPSEKTESLFGDIGIENIMKIANAYRSINRSGDPRITLLKAIKPYMRPGRGESVETAIKLLGLIKLAPLLGEIKDIL